MFEWNKSKAETNKSKHGISFADTFAVFDDPNAITVEDDIREEQRYVTLGMDVFGCILVVVYTWRGDRVRIISARKAAPKEVRQYEGEI